MAILRFLTVALLVAGWELWRLFKHGGYSPSLAVILGSILVIAASRWLWGFENSEFDRLSDPVGINGSASGGAAARVRNRCS